jgi:predicted metal-dependent hydrolase
MRATSSFTLSNVSSDLTLGGAPLSLRVSPRARRMRLRVDPRTRAVVLTVPRRVSHRRALAWAAQHETWVASTLSAMPEAAAIAPECFIPLAGVPHRLDWDPARPRRIEVGEGRILAGGPAQGLEGRVLRWLRAQGLALLERETREFAAKAGVGVAGVRVGDPLSRWGSCSSSGTIRYSWRLVMAPEYVRRATVAHEVAHLVHMHHGPEFHAFVAELLDADPKPARLWLRREGAGLHRIGRKAA